MAHTQLPAFNMDKSETDCCPRFDPAGWDGEEFKFKDRLFVRAATRSFLHIPLNIKSVIANTFSKIEAADAAPQDEYLMLSSDLSPWRSELYFAVTRDVPDTEMVKLSGTFLAKVFEGGYQNMGRWSRELNRFVESQGKQIKKCFFFYTTCPKCAKVYGKNYVVGLPQVA